MAPRRLTVIATVVAITAPIAACGDEYERGVGVYGDTSSTPATATATSPLPIEPTQTTAAGAAETSEVGRLSATERRSVRAASTVARRFLAGYLPYSYGRRSANGIRGLTPTLRRLLARQAPRVPPALAAKARPRLRGLTLSGIAGRQVILLARIDDGQGRYAALLTVRRQGQRWAVSQVR